MSTNANRVAAILGVGPGLGAAVARRFGREGYSVALMARGLHNLAPIGRNLEAAGHRALHVPTDATDAESVASAFAEIRERLGDPDVFVYNAGAFQHTGVLEASPEDFDAAWRTNCFGAFLGLKEVLPAMVARGKGTVLLTGATASLRGGAGFSCLAVGKFGLRALAQSVARELGPRGVHVAHVVIDGMIATPSQRTSHPERGREALLDPDAIAETYWQLHRQDRSAWTLELDLRPAVERF